MLKRIIVSTQVNFQQSQKLEILDFQKKNSTFYFEMSQKSESSEKWQFLQKIDNRNNLKTSEWLKNRTGRK